jgi:class 3 adenylate cyclase
MIENTEKFRKIGGASQTTQEHIRDVMKRVTELDAQLRDHLPTLRQRGMTLPARTAGNLTGLHTGLEALNRELTARQIQLRQLRALPQTTALINSTLDTDSVLQQVMDTAIQLTGAERGYIMLRSAESSKMEFRTARGIDRKQLNRDEFIISNTIINEVATGGQPVLTHNARNDPNYIGQESIVGYQLRSILAVPLSVSGDIIGVVYVDNRIMDGVFTDRELNLLQALANQAAVALRNAQLFETARQQLSQITALRDLLNNMFASIASGLVTVDGNDIVTGSNRGAEAFILSPHEQSGGKRLVDLLPAVAQHCADALRRVRQQQTAETGEIETEIGGRTRYWRVAITPLQGQSGGVVIVLDDLTEQRDHDLLLSYLPNPALAGKVDLTTLGGQERMITVISADVRGFSTFSELLQPEVLMEVINKYLSVASEAINLQEGIVDKYLGDCVTGLFNTQLNEQDDHVMRAVRSSLAMLYDVRALHEVLPEAQRLNFGIGIHTGLSVLGNMGSADRREFTALGEAMDLSKLLQENAAPGEIILSEATYALVKDQFDAEALVPRKTKGDTHLTVMYKLIGRKRRGA